MLKREMRSTISHGQFKTDKLVTLEFTPEELADPALRLERQEATEINYQGKMYDIVSESYVDGVLHIQCIADNEEDSLLVSFLKLIRDSHHGSKKHRQGVRFSFGQFLLVQKISIDQFLKADTSFIFPSRGSSIQEGFLNSFSPPPWVVS